jgi:choline monooxygenase
VRNLDPRFYVDASIFERERNELFTRTWQLLGPVSDLGEPGSYVAAEIANMKIFAVRSRDGELRGFKNVCRHRGARLLP